MLSFPIAIFLSFVALYFLLAEPQKKKRLTPAQKKAKALEQENKDLRLQLGMPPQRRRAPDPKPVDSKPAPEHVGGSINPMMMVMAAVAVAAVNAKAKAKAKETQDETAELSD